MRLATVRIVLAGAIACASACGGSGVFECESDEQCRAGAVDGACQGNGYCSFPDEGCPTGHRFGAAAPAGVANTCVEPIESTGSTGGPTNGSTLPNPDDGPQLDSSTADPTTGTTQALDGESSESLGSTSAISGSSGDDSAATTTGVIESCGTLSIVDEFDADGIDPMWSVTAPLGTTVEQQGGQLEISVSWGPGWRAGNIRMDLPPLSGGWARVAITDPTDLELDMTGGITLTNGVCDLQIYIDEGWIRTFRWNNDTQMGNQLAVHDLPALPVWLQLRQDDVGLHFEWSEDQMTWQELTMGAFPECGDITGPLSVLVVGGAQFMQPDETGLRRFERFEVCVP